MKSKGIKTVLQKKLTDWVKSIDSEELQKRIKSDTIITGGSIVSLLTNEQVNDYDIYFRTYDTALAVANYYIDKYKALHPEKDNCHFRLEETEIEGEKRLKVFIQSKGVEAEEEEETVDGIADSSEPTDVGDIEDVENIREVAKETEEEKYRPVFFTDNAISLSNKVQIILRFYGEVEELHKNFDFVHCTCSYDWANNDLTLPPRALEAIINKELFYCGSLYPVCSVIRTRKFIKRGWQINAGQYLKMCLQISELDLMNIDVLREQTIGVDSAYFAAVLQRIEKKESFDMNYLIEIINRVF